jgi:hypothetical protein
MDECDAHRILACSEKRREIQLPGSRRATARPQPRCTIESWRGKCFWRGRMRRYLSNN